MTDIIITEIEMLHRGYPNRTLPQSVFLHNFIW